MLLADCMQGFAVMWRECTRIMLRDGMRCFSIHADVMIEDSLEEARQLRDASVQRSVMAKPSAARHIHKIYPEAGSEDIPDAVNSLLGACSGGKCCFIDADVSMHGLCRLLGKIDAARRHCTLLPQCCRHISSGLPCAYKECRGLCSMQPAYCHCSGCEDEGHGHLGVMQPAGDAAHSCPGKTEAAAQQAAGATLCPKSGVLDLKVWVSEFSDRDSISS